MKYNVKPGSRSGNIEVPASKSVAHRLLICAALSKEKNTLICEGISKDVSATINCLNGLGAKIEIRNEKYLDIEPICKYEKKEQTIMHEKKKDDIEQEHLLKCNESGSTLRFLLPVAAALGEKAFFQMADGLAVRPMDTLIDVLSAHGVKLCKEKNTIISEGQLIPGDYEIAGNISSQYISGLLFALPLLNGDSKLKITGSVESGDYIKMTEEILKLSGIYFEKNENEYKIPGNQQYKLNGMQTIERDWSNAAFFLCMGAVSEKGITIDGMKVDSVQGDRAIVDILRGFGANVEMTEKKITVKRSCSEPCKEQEIKRQTFNQREIKQQEQNQHRLIQQRADQSESESVAERTIDASGIPDLVPTISVLASVSCGTTKIINAGRLRIKESDRLKTTSSMLRALGANVEEQDDGLTIHGKEQLKGGIVDAANDHRIAMAAAVASCACTEEVVVLGAECVEKSFPAFWKLFEKLEVQV